MKLKESPFARGTEVGREAHHTIARIANKIIKRGVPASVDVRDLRQEGWMGLLEAHGRSTVPVDAKQFWGFATPRINGAMYDHLRGHDFLKRVQRTRRKRLFEAQGRFEAEHGREATKHELAELLGLSSGQIEESLALPATIESIEGGELWEMLSQSHSCEDEESAAVHRLHQAVLKSSVDATLALLTTRDRKLLLLRLVREEKMPQVAKTIGVSHTHAHVLLSKAKISFVEHYQGLAA